jgi:hypothetical protein
MSGSLAFFERLLLRVSGTFLTEAQVTLGAATAQGARQRSLATSKEQLNHLWRLFVISIKKKIRYMPYYRNKTRMVQMKNSNKTLTTPGGRRIPYLLSRQEISPQLFVAKRNSKKQIRRLVSSSCPSQYLQAAQEETMSTN